MTFLFPHASGHAVRALSTTMTPTMRRMPRIAAIATETTHTPTPPQPHVDPVHRVNDAGRKAIMALRNKALKRLKRTPHTFDPTALASTDADTNGTATASLALTHETPLNRRVRQYEAQLTARRSLYLAEWQAAKAYDTARRAGIPAAALPARGDVSDAAVPDEGQAPPAPPRAYATAHGARQRASAEATRAWRQGRLPLVRHYRDLRRAFWHDRQALQTRHHLACLDAAIQGRAMDHVDDGSGEVGAWGQAAVTRVGPALDAAIDRALATPTPFSTSPVALLRQHAVHTRRTMATEALWQAEQALAAKYQDALQAAEDAIRAYDEQDLVQGL